MNPMQWAYGTDYTGNPRTDTRIVVVANEEGLQSYVSQDRLNLSLQQAAVELKYTPDRSRQIHLNMWGECTLQGLHPPKLS